MERLARDPHIIDVFASGVLPNGQAYLVMRLCAGGSLAALLAERGPMSPAAVASIGETLAETLDRAHRMGVLHRDIKPHNILLDNDGSPVLADFGIVALQQTDLSMTATARWTAAYAAPELFHDHPASVRTDVYALAATLYTLLAGYAPHHERWRTPSPAELFARRNEPPDNLEGVPPALMMAIQRALAPSPHDRYVSANEFAAALRETIPAPEPLWDNTTWREPAAGFDEGAPWRDPDPRPEHRDAGPMAVAPVRGSPRWQEMLEPPVAEFRRAPTDEPYADLGAATRSGRHAAPETPIQLSDVDSGHHVALRPGIQPGLLATALLGTLTLAVLGLGLAAPGWMAAWALLTVLIGVTSAAGARALGIATFALTMTVALIVAVKSYNDQQVGSLAWVLGATLIAIMAGTWGHTSAAVRLRWFAWRQRVKRRRWWGEASVRPELTSLYAVPAARFLRLAGGTCHYAVVSGSGVALVRWASWPAGRYLVTDTEVRLDGQTWSQGTTELERARRGLSFLDESATHTRARVFLAVDTPGELRKKELKGDLTVCHTRDLAPALGTLFAEDPYDVDLELLSSLLPLAENG